MSETKISQSKEASSHRILFKEQQTEQIFQEQTNRRIQRLDKQTEHEEIESFCKEEGLQNHPS